MILMFIPLKGYFQALFGSIEILLSSMHVKNLVVPAADEAKSIWTNKLGFRKMTYERVSGSLILVWTDHLFLPCLSDSPFASWMIVLKVKL